MNVYGGLNGSYGQWLVMVFLEKGEKDYLTGNGNSTGSKRD